MKIISIILLNFVIVINKVFAEPDIECSWLPGCDRDSDEILFFVWDIVAELIKYVAVVAVIALIAAGFMYIFSAWEDEKTKKARKWIIWSLIAVFISISWYFLINIINDAKIKF